MELNKELSDITIVSLEQAVAAPYCGLLLADAGARVIKVERPEGDFARDYDNGANGTILHLGNPHGTLASTSDKGNEGIL